MSDKDDWLEFLHRWHAVIAGLRGRYPDGELDRIHFEGMQEPSLGIGTLLGGHEQGRDELTHDEEDELWELASLTDCDDEDLLNDYVRAKSVRNRPIRTVRSRYPLRGGGHGARTGQPGKSRFPLRWTDSDAIAYTMDVARQPSSAVKLPTGDFLARGERDEVTVAVVVSPEGDVLTSYPVEGPGVEHPADEIRKAAAQRLQSLLDALVPADHERRTHLDELHAVGEWPYVLRSLRALDLPMSDEQRAELAELCRLAGLPDSSA